MNLSQVVCFDIFHQKLSGKYQILVQFLSNTVFQNAYDKLCKHLIFKQKFPLLRA